MRCGMPEPFDVRHLRAYLRSFAFLIHEKRMKLTTKPTKDTKNLLAGANDPLSHNRNLADIAPLL